MGRKANEKPRIPSITWTTALLWSLIHAAQEAENRNVLLGKEKDGKTTPDSKTKVFKRIAEKLLPTIYAVDPESAANRTSSKWDALKKTYRGHVARLHQTGGGLRGDEETQNPHEYSECYIGADGPDSSTTSSARNLWDQITKEFVFFPELHRLLSSRPSLVPPAITTGVGPSGQKIVHYQAPTSDARSYTNLDPNIDTALGQELFTPPHALPAPVSSCSTSPPSFSVPSAPPHTPDMGDKENIPLANIKTPANTTNPTSYGSTKLDDAVKKARENIKPLSGTKRASNGVEDMFTEMSRKTYELTEARYRDEISYKRQKLNLEERQIALRELEAGVITTSEYRHICGLNNLKGKEKAVLPPSSPPPCVFPTSIEERSSTPDWDYERLDQDMGGLQTYHRVFEIDSDST